MKRLYFAFFAVMLACCTGYQEELDEMRVRIDAVREACDGVDADAGALLAFIDAARGEDKAVSFIPVVTGGSVTAFIICFENGGMVSVRNQDCGVSVIEEGGVYCWAENGIPVMRDGKRVEITSRNAVPEFVVEDNNLRVSFDGGKSWSDAGAFDKEGDISLITEIETEQQFGIVIGNQNAAISKTADSCSVEYTLTGGVPGLQVLAIAPSGMSARVTALSESRGTIDIESVSPEADSTVIVTVSDGRGAVVMDKIAVIIDRSSFIEPEEPVLPDFILEVDYEECAVRNHQKESVYYEVIGGVGSVSLDIITKGSWTYKVVSKTATTGHLTVWCAGALSPDPVVLIASDSAGRRDTVEVAYKEFTRKVSVMGDSYSAYQGYSTLAFYPRAGIDVTSKKDMWWYKFIDHYGYLQDKIDTWSGSTVCCTGYDGADFTFEAFCGPRAANLGRPDIVLVCGGTNDSWAGSPIGDYQYSYWTPLDLFSFRPALASLFNALYENYGENLEIYFILNDHLSDAIDESVRKICKYYDVGLVELVDIDKKQDHPTKKGQQQIYEQLVEVFEQRSR